MKNGWLMVVVGGGDKIMAGRGWSWMTWVVARFSNVPFKGFKKIFTQSVYVLCSNREICVSTSKYIFYL